MKKLFCIFLTLIALTLLLQAQTPQMLNYQGILKNPDGSIQPDAQAELRLEFIQDGIAVYMEEHTIHTNSKGYFSIHPGMGNALSGCFDEIDWSLTPITLRSLLNGKVIAETILSSVPYALYANRVAGQDKLEANIDSLKSNALRMGSLTDSIATLAGRLQQADDTTSHLIVALQLHIDSLQCGIDSLHISLDTLTQHTEHHAQQIDVLERNFAFYNATAEHPLPNGTYHTAATARESLPQQARKSGMVITFRSDTLSWESIQFASNDTSLWNAPEAWRDYGSYGNLILPFAESAAETRLQVPAYNRQTGLIISYYDGSNIRNEQFSASSLADSAWCADSSWTQLLDNTHLSKIDKALGRLDSVSNALDNRLQELSRQEAWFYTDRADLFSQVGGIDLNGTATDNFDLVHTPLIPISPNWVVKTFSVGKYPGISFFANDGYASRIASATDSIGSVGSAVQYDLSETAIPDGAKFFSVNLPLSQQKNVLLQERTPIADANAEFSAYNFTELLGCFTHLDAYIDHCGNQISSSQFRHTGFIALSEKPYKIFSTGMYTRQNIAPVVVYFKEPSFGSAVGYDIGYVNNDRSTSREIIVSASTAPADANYFVVNWIPSLGECSIKEGFSTESLLFSADKRIASLETNRSCYAGRKLVTLGDSFTYNLGNRGKYWQQWLAEWLGVTWSLEETHFGLDGHAAMGCSGSWIMPNDLISMSIRCMDVVHYNPDIIILYGGENDQFGAYKWGTIDDEPFLPSQVIDLSADSDIRTLSAALLHTADTVATPHLPRTLLYIHEATGKRFYYLTDESAWEKTASWTLARNCISFYAAYKGVVQRLCTDNPNAAIYCLSLMQCDHTRYDGPLTLEGLDNLRKTKSRAIKEIAEFYGVQFIDLWNNSGINNFNAPMLYSDWLHPNANGYRKLAECIYRTLK